ncbi:MAG: polysaccharide deacetylase family protein [Smithellaceae bacterium]|nr:polysaccharide deacetylase family protein [Smithellaceae bacterium]NLX50900.1 polysaccharide deacetylase family protein [Deltaproteobacteria bacterium]
MEGGKNRPRPALIAGVAFLIAAFGLFFFEPLLAAAWLLAYVVLCVAACFFPQTNFLGPVISRGRTGTNQVALTFDDGPSPSTTPAILDALDRHCAPATFFVSGLNAEKYPELIADILRRGHAVGNHTYRHDPLVMLKGYRTLYREVNDAIVALRRLGVDARAFRPPVGIVNPGLFPILDELGLFCVTFNRRARDAGNLRVLQLAEKILGRVKGDDIILLHDVKPRRPGDETAFAREIEKILAGIRRRGLDIVPLAELIGRETMSGVRSS